MSPVGLRVEHGASPLGVTVRVPRLSWRLPDGVGCQVAYQIRAGAWDSGRVESDQSLLVRYGGPPLSSGERVEWAVRVWTNGGDGVSDWSEPDWWEMGLLDQADWTARWIEPVEAENGRTYSGPRPGHVLRHSFRLDDGVRRGRLYATAHGIYEVFLNGQRVGDLELTPGFTSYSSTVQVQTYDVTDQLAVGENVIEAVLSDGWYRGQNGGNRQTNLFGDRVAMLAQLNIDRADGSTERVATGPEWRFTTSSVVSADLMEGQVVDLRVDPDGWRPVLVAEHDLERLRASASPPVRRVEELRPVSVTRLPSGRQIIDLGQNINGWVRLSNLGPTGTTLTLTYGEALDADGDVTQDNIVIDVDAHPALRDTAELQNWRRPLQVDRVTSSGRPGEVFEPRHTTHGFHYVRVEGHPGELTPDDVSSIAVHTDLRRTGWFECSDERLNKLHEAAVWSFRGNACDIPTDCPTRERAGFTGDWQIFLSTAAFLYDVAGFTAKWLRDLASEQQDDGRVLDCAPNPYPPELAGSLGMAHGSAGWGDAAVIVPWEIYRAYGDRDLLDEQWDSMTAWVDYAARAAREHRHPSRIARRPEPAAHEEFLWDTGFHWGEWLEPSELDDLPALRDGFATADKSDVATAYLCHSAGLLARIATVLGRDDDATRYADLAAATRSAWQAEFISPHGRLTPDSQATHVRALAFGLVPDELRDRTAERLVKLIRDAGTHLGTGFLATPYLLPVLADTGHLDVAYELLLQDSEPSWLTMIDRGATTIWEAWNGIDTNSDPHLSLNHYSKGAVISFLHRYVAGIQLPDNGDRRGTTGNRAHSDTAPAYRHFRVAPQPGGGITRARATHDSPYGRITSAWRIDDDTFTLDVTVPPGATAEVRLPDGQRLDATPGTTTHTCPAESRLSDALRDGF